MPINVSFHPFTEVNSCHATNEEMGIHPQICNLQNCKIPTPVKADDASFIGMKRCISERNSPQLRDFFEGGKRSFKEGS